MELKMHLLQEQIAFFEDKENLEWKIRNVEEFPEESNTHDEEIESEWQKSLNRLRLLLAELKELLKRRNEDLHSQRNPADRGTCVEIEAQGRRLVLEVGLPLTPLSQGLLPLIPGFREADETLLGVVISHPPQDHYGLAKYLRLIYLFSSALPPANS